MKKYEFGTRCRNNADLLLLKSKEQVLILFLDEKKAMILVKLLTDLNSSSLLLQTQKRRVVNDLLTLICKLSLYPKCTAKHKCKDFGKSSTCSVYLLNILLKILPAISFSCGKKSFLHVICLA